MLEEWQRKSLWKLYEVILQKHEIIILLICIKIKYKSIRIIYRRFLCLITLNYKFVTQRFAKLFSYSTASSFTSGFITMISLYLWCCFCMESVTSLHHRLHIVGCKTFKAVFRSSASRSRSLSWCNVTPIWAAPSWS